MTDDKAIEAARSSVLLEMMDEVDVYAGGLKSDVMVDRIARAALAAADKVRAEGFNADFEAHNFWPSQPQALKDALADRLRRAFAAGLAKGEAVERERIAKWFESKLTEESEPDWGWGWDHNRLVIAYATAIRAGETP